MRIRAATRADAAGLAKVHVDSWRTTYRGIVPEEALAHNSYQRREEIWARQLDEARADQFTYLVETGDGQVVGFVSAGPERSGDPLYRGEVYAIYLLASHQRQGIGKGLFRHAAARLAELGMSSLLVWVLERNPSRAFYEAAGGTLVRRETMQIHGASLVKVAYGWKETLALIAAGDTDE
jgi:GNAT superfamily N-acetyltransferase